MSVTSDVAGRISEHFSSIPVDPSLALLFPGQGSQKVGMGLDLSARPAVSKLYEAAGDILKTDLRKLCFEGPEEELTRTFNAQPAILVTSIAGVLRAIEDGKMEKAPAVMAGHSLGEYTALVCAGSLTFEEALLLVRERGLRMEEAGREQPGTMAALVGLDHAAASDICRQSGAQICNYNSPTQFVIGGKHETVEIASSMAKERGGRGLPLSVSGAFHTPLMETAAQRFNPALDSVTISDAHIPVIGNVSAGQLSRAHEIRAELKEQVLRPVLWHQSIRAMADAGVRTFLEPGPGRVLTQMVKRSDPELEAISLEQSEARVKANV